MFLNASRLLALVAVLFVAGCGNDQNSADDELPRTARQLAQDTAELQADIVETGRALLPEGADAERAARELDTLERRADRLAAGVEERLPEGYAGRESLRSANRRAARAIQDLREFARAADRNAVRRARARLAGARERLAAAADQLTNEADGEERRALGELERELDERLPSIIAR